MNRDTIRSDPGLSAFVEQLYAEPETHVSEGMKNAIGSGYTLPGMLGESAEWGAWLCNEPNNGRDVIVKAAREDSPLSPDEIERFLSEEFRVLDSIRSPRAVSALRFQADGAASFLVMSYVGDHDIVQFAMGPRVHSPESLEQVLFSAVEAVADIHSEKVVHGDLKPQHFVMNGATPVLIDFGLSANLGEKGRSLFFRPRVGGSEMYIAPELLGNNAVGHEYTHDVYSLGMVLEAVVSEWSKKHPGRIRPAMRRIIRKATHQDPHQRYTDAVAMRAAITAAIGRPGKKWISSAAGAAAVLGLAGAVIGGTLFSRGVPATAGNPHPPPQTFQDVDWTQAHTASGTERDEYLEQIAQLSHEDQQTWEASLVLRGRTEFPFGAKPYGGAFVHSAEYHAPSGSLVWTNVDGVLHVIREHAPNPLVIDAGDHYSRGTLNRDGDRLAALDADGSVIEFDLSMGASSKPLSTPLRRANRIHYSDGQLVAMEHITNAVHVWDGSGITTRSDQTTAHRVRHGDAVFLAMWGLRDEDTGSLWIETTAGDVVFQPTTVPSASRPVAVDFHKETGLLCVATLGGELLLYRSDDDAWQQIDVPFDSHFTAIQLAPSEGRIFIAGLGVHGIDLTTRERTIMLEGIHDEARTLQLAWNTKDRDLTAVTTRGVTRWIADD